LADETKTSVAAVCRALELSRSSVYARRKRPQSRRAQDTAQLDVEVAAVHAESKQRYGSPRVHRALRRQGRRVSRKRVEARMRALDLRSKRVKRFRRTTQADSAHAPSPNVLDREFTRATPHEAWCGDITFIWTQQGWVYLALLIDLCTRSIVGWAVSERCDAELALRCLNRAAARHRPSAGLLHHTIAARPLHRSRSLTLSLNQRLEA
jgi:transposase InsO family protein